jgi:peptidoglycan/xylan/chitin deacetylase (PgdA/CDA1 family)
MFGVRVRKNPTSAKAIAVTGHKIANHAYGHINLRLQK